MNTRSLRIFLEVCSAGSFSGAARNLGLTQPAVSFQIRALEKETGSLLIDRSAGHCRLTQAGETLLEHARRILEAEEELQRDMEALRDEVSGPLTIAASNIPGEYILPLILSGLKSRFPLIEPGMEITDSGKVIDQVKAGEVDLGCVGYREEDDRLRYGPLCSDRLVFIAPPDHPLVGRRSMGPGELEGENLIWREEGSGTRSHMSRILAGLGLESSLEGSMELGSTMAVIQAVAAGAGLSLTSLFAAGAYMETGKVAALDLEGPRLKRDFHYVLLRRRPVSAATAALLRVLEEARPQLEARLEALAIK